MENHLHHVQWPARDNWLNLDRHLLLIPFGLQFSRARLVNAHRP